MLNALVNKAPSSVIMQTLSYCPIVGGIPKGSGTGKSKQLAKEEAARQAQTALGWGPYHCALFQRFLYVKEVLTRTLIIHQNAVLLCLFVETVVSDLLSMYIR
jgi:hypothetical protein